MGVSKATRERWKAEWADPKYLHEAWEQLQAQKADPFSFSKLPYWLGLEVWSADEGLLILANVEPGTVQIGAEYAPGPYFNTEWTNALPFDEHVAFFQVPPPIDMKLEECGGDAEYFESYLVEVEGRVRKLRAAQTIFESLEHRFERSPSAKKSMAREGGYLPAAMIAWALSIGFKPAWYEWAVQRHLLPEPIALEKAPYFDADAEDYPYLLHVAIRAWEAARASDVGTPRQRIDAFLEASYPTMTPATRNAIALVANWKKSPGRPKGNR